MASSSRLVQGIAGGTTKSNIVKVGLGTSINLYPEVQQSEHSCQIMNRTVQGEVLAAEIPGRCRGMYRVSRGIDNKPTLYAVYDDKLWLINSHNVAWEIGKLNSYGTEVHMVETGGYGSAHPHLICVDGTSVYSVNTGLSIGDQEADFRTIQLPLRVNTTDEQIKPTHCAYLYGYLIVNDSGTDAFYTSYQYPFEVEDTQTPAFYEKRREFIDWWMTLTDEQRADYKKGEIKDGNYLKYKEFIDGTASDEPEKYDLFRVNTVQFAQYGFVTYSEWQPDNTIALASNGKYLYTFGERSYQIFSYNDDANNPFTSPNNAAGNIGIKAPNSLCVLGQTVIWLGSSDIGENGVFMLSGTELKRVSTTDIERELKTIVNPENGYSSVWMENHHTFWSITFEDSEKTFVYDGEEDAWHYRASYDEKNKLREWRYNHATFAYGHVYVGTKDALCYMDENKFSEHDGRPILKLRRGSMLTHDDRPFFIDSIELICNNGQHTLFSDSVGQQQAPEVPIGYNPRVTFRWSWDGATWSDYRDSFMGAIGQYEWRTVLWHCGMGRWFTLEVSTTEPIPFAIQNMKVQYCPTSMF